MKTKQLTNDTPILTIADLCEALADGRLAAQRDEQFYTVRSQDLRRFVQSAQVTQLPPTRTPLDQLFAAS